MRPTSLILAAAGVLTALLSLRPGAALAEDAPAHGGGMPTPPSKIEHPFALAMVGTWDLAFKAGDMTRTGVAVWREASEGTALVEELRVGSGDDAFYGFGVLTTADGKAVTTTWFDTDSGIDPQVYRGTLTDDGWTSSVEMPGRGTWTMSMAKKGEGRTLSMKAGEQTLFEIAYTKAAKPVEDVGTSEKLLVKHPLAEAMLGTWDAKGSFEMGGNAMPYTSTVSWRRGLGGSCLLAEQSMEMPGMGADHGIAIARFDVEKKTMKFWGWPSKRPHNRMEGTVTDTAFEGTAVEPGPFGPMTFRIEKSDEGFTSTFSSGPMKGTEKRTRRK